MDILTESTFLSLFNSKVFNLFQRFLLFDSLISHKELLCPYKVLNVFGLDAVGQLNPLHLRLDNREVGHDSSDAFRSMNIFVKNEQLWNYLLVIMMEDGLSLGPHWSELKGLTPSLGQVDFASHVEDGVLSILVGLGARDVGSLSRKFS